MNLELINTSINWCLAQLKAEQNPDGSFTSITREFCRGTIVTTHHRRTTFYSSAITLALQECHQPEAEAICGQAVSYLLHESGIHYEYRYWSRNQTSLPDYPPDLDDTLLALAAIHCVDNRLITGRCLAWLLRHLITNEKKPGGPYHTWLATPAQKSAWPDIDNVVNANIYFALTQLEIDAPLLGKFCESIIQEQRWHSPYYVGIWPTLYSLARLRCWQKQDSNWQTIWQEHIHSPNDTLSQALVLSSALRTDCLDNEAVRTLAKKLIKNCTDPHNPLENCAYIMERHGADTTELSGSRGWTLAATIEALELFKQKYYPPVQLLPANAAKKHQDSSWYLAESHFNELPDSLRTLAKESLENLKAIDTRGEISLTAYHANEYLNRPLTPPVIQQLSTLTILGWLTFQIYDDWIDDQNQKYPLTIAQQAWREVGTGFAEICRGQTKLHQWIKSILHEVEISNGLEHLHNLAYRTNEGFSLPMTTSNLKPKTSKAIGQAIGLGTIFALASPSREQALIPTKKFYHHHLSAKQLCDDIHDWEKDLDQLILTPVTEAVIAQYHLNNPDQPLVTPSTCLKELREIYWNHVLPNTLADIHTHVTEATTWCHELPWQQKPDFFLEGLQQIQSAAQRCRQEFYKTSEFISTYAAITA